MVTLSHRITHSQPMGQTKPWANHRGQTEKHERLMSVDWPITAYVYHPSLSHLGLSALLIVNADRSLWLPKYERYLPSGDGEWGGDAGGHDLNILPVLYEPDNQREQRPLEWPGGNRHDHCPPTGLSKLGHDAVLKVMALFKYLSRVLLKRG